MWVGRAVSAVSNALRADDADERSDDGFVAEDEADGHDADPQELVRGYKKMMVDFQYEQLQLSREYARVLAEKEDELVRLRPAGGAGSMAASAAASAGGDLMARPREKELEQVIEVYETRLREMMDEHADRAAGAAAAQLRIQRLEGKVKAAAAASPKRAGGARDARPGMDDSDSDSSGHGAAAYHAASAESQERVDTAEAATRAAVKDNEELAVKLKACVALLLLLLLLLLLYYYYSHRTTPTTTN